MIRRTVGYALRACQGRACQSRIPSTRTRLVIPTLIRREGLATVQEPAGLPVAQGKEKTVVFDQTSSPELDEVLLTILHKVILPARLPIHARRMIAREENRQKLAASPIITEVDGYEYRFPILDFRQGHIPSTQPLVRQALRLMRTREDWANLNRLLSGLTRAHRDVPAQTMRLLVQRAGDTGNMYAVIDALERNGASRFRVLSLPAADHVLHQLQARAWGSGYAWKETRRAAGWASRFLAVLADDKDAAWLVREPQIIGQALHLAAANAIFHNGGRDDDEERVVDLAKQLADEWEYRTAKLKARQDHHNGPAAEGEAAEVDGSSGSTPAEPRLPGLLDFHQSREDTITKGREKIKAGDTAGWYLHIDPSRHVAVACYMIRAVEWASRVVPPELASRLLPVRQGCERELERLVSLRDGMGIQLAGRDRLRPAKVGWTVYDAIMASEQPLNWGPSREQVEAEFKPVVTEAEGVETTEETKGDEGDKNTV